jgi:hypothetical protein
VSATISPGKRRQLAKACDVVSAAKEVTFTLTEVTAIFGDTERVPGKTVMPVDFAQEVLADVYDSLNALYYAVQADEPTRLTEAIYRLQERVRFARKVLESERRRVFECGVSP